MFSVQFAEQNSFEIEYEGRRVNAFYKFQEKGNYKLELSFISTASICEQAIVIYLDSFQGELAVNEKKIKVPKGCFPRIVFEERNAPRKIELSVTLQEGELTICNGSFDLQVPEICRTLDGGCAMIIEELENNHLRFYCNDYENDDDFDDLIFDLQIMKIK